MDQVRRYELKARAERMAETRQRIVEATMKLHTTVGPTRTSISAIADAADVQRHTVYSHFPEEKALFAACGGLFAERNPMPEPAAFRLITDPAARARAALAATYAYFRAHEKELWPIVRDIPFMPHLVGRRLGPHRDAVASAVLDGWKVGRRAARLRALFLLALRFETWRALTREDGLTDDDAVSVMLEALLCAARKTQA